MRGMIFLLVVLGLGDFAQAAPGEKEILTLQARPHATCTKIQCREDNPCCNLCGHEGWKVLRDGEWCSVTAVNGEFPQFPETHGCDMLVWGQMEVTGYWEEDTFYAVEWKLPGSNFQERKEYTKEGWISGSRAPIAYYLVDNATLVGKKLSEVEAMLGPGSAAPGEFEKASECKAWYLGKHPTSAEMPPALPYYDTYLIVHLDGNKEVDFARVYGQVPGEFKNAKPGK